MKADRFERSARAPVSADLAVSAQPRPGTQASRPGLRDSGPLGLRSPPPFDCRRDNVALKSGGLNGRDTLAQAIGLGPGADDPRVSTTRLSQGHRLGSAADRPKPTTRLAARVSADFGLGFRPTPVPVLRRLRARSRSRTSAPQGRRIPAQGDNPGNPSSQQALSPEGAIHSEGDGARREGSKRRFRANSSPALGGSRGGRPGLICGALSGRPGAERSSGSNGDHPTSSRDDSATARGPASASAAPRLLPT